MNKKTLSFGQYLLSALFIFNSQPGWALGLGNMEVRSHLGEPLRATVKLIDTPRALDAGCFRLLQSTDGYPPSTLNASILLHEGANGDVSLAFKSYQTLNDPIVNLTLVADCENQISREYVLLLDPPQFREVKPLKIMPEASAAIVQPLTVVDAGTSSPLPVASTTPARSAAISQTQPAPPPAKRRQKPVATARNEIRPPSTTTSVPKPAGTAETDQPRLVVSGGGNIPTDFLDAPLRLQMSIQLNEWPALEEGQPLSTEEAADEVTAMAGRLAFLESQIIALQERNTELESLRVEAAELRARQSATGQWNHWLLYGLMTLLIIALIAAAEWFRRRNSQRRLAAEVAIWEELAPSSHTPDGIENEDHFAATPIQPEQSYSPAATVAGQKPDMTSQHAVSSLFKEIDSSHGAGATINEDILEQAEVFVAHGRTNLAIALLQDHLHEFPKLSPAPWLMLLGLLKRDGQAAEYETATNECQRYFNVAVQSYDAPLVTDNSSIEDYPRVKEQLEQVWDTTEALPYLDDLIFNRRLEARQGFERNAYLEILLLRSIANELGFTNSPKTKATVVPIHNKKSDLDLARTVITVAQQEELSPGLAAASTSDTAEFLFEDMFDTPDLPKDKSQPLDFELEFKSKG